MKQNNYYLNKSNTTFEEFDTELSTKPVFSALSHDLMDCIMYHPDTISQITTHMELDSARFTNSMCNQQFSRTKLLEKNFLSVLLVEMAINRSKSNI